MAAIYWGFSNDLQKNIFPSQTFIFSIHLPAGVKGRNQTRFRTIFLLAKKKSVQKRKIEISSPTVNVFRSYLVKLEY